MFVNQYGSVLTPTTINKLSLSWNKPWSSWSQIITSKHQVYFNWRSCSPVAALVPFPVPLDFPPIPLVLCWCWTFLELDLSHHHTQPTHAPGISPFFPRPWRVISPGTFGPVHLLLSPLSCPSVPFRDLPPFSVPQNLPDSPENLALVARSGRVKSSVYPETLGPTNFRSCRFWEERSESAYSPA